LKKKESKPKQPPAKNKPKSVINKKEIKRNYDPELLTEYLKASMIDFDKRFDKLKIEVSKLISEHPFIKDYLDSYFRGLYGKLIWDFRFQSDFHFEWNIHSKMKMTNQNIREMCLDDTFRIYEMLIQMIAGDLTGNYKKRINELTARIKERNKYPNQKYTPEMFEQVNKKVESERITKQSAIEKTYYEYFGKNDYFSSLDGFRHQYYAYEKSKRKEKAERVANKIKDNSENEK